MFLISAQNIRGTPRGSSSKISSHNMGFMVQDKSAPEVVATYGSHPSYPIDLSPSRERRSEIGLEDILLNHPMGIEIRSVDGNGVNHDIGKTASLLIIHGDYHAFQFIIESRGIP